MKDKRSTSTYKSYANHPTRISQKIGSHGWHGCTQQSVTIKTLFQVKEKQLLMSKNFKDSIVSVRQIRSQKAITK